MAFLIFAFILIIVALVFVIPVLLRKTDSDQIDHQDANVEAIRQQLQAIDEDAGNDLVKAEHLQTIREETEALLLVELQQQAQQAEKKDRSTIFYSISAITIALAVPIFAFLIYAAVGEPAALLSVQKPTITDQHSESDQNPPSIDEMIAKLEQRLAGQPDDVEGWFTLARTYMVTQRFDQAVLAMEKVYSLTGDDPDILTRYADAVVMANDGSFNQKANQLIQRALELKPDHIQAMWLAGMSALRSLNYEQAIDYFERSKAIITDPQSVAELNRLINTAKERAGLVDEADETPGISKQTQAADQAGVNVVVMLDDQLKSLAGPNDDVFIFAKAASGPPMPLAVSKHKMNELPLEIQLNDSMAMMPDLKLSSFDQIVVSARISKTGEPQAQKGDLQGQSQVINPKTTDGLTITIDQIVQ